MTDYISREEFMASCEGRYCAPCKEQGKDSNGVRCRACWVDDMLSEVIDALSADVEPVRHGKWDHFEENDAEFGYVRWSKCSLCHASIGRSGWLRYCPWCGAKMDLEVDHDD